MKHTGKLTKLSNLDIELNTVNTLICEQRYSDAEKLLHNILKVYGKNYFSISYALQLFELISFVKYCQSKHDEAFKFCLKSSHLDPFNITTWIEGLLIGEKYMNQQQTKAIVEDEPERKFMSSVLFQMARCNTFMRNLKGHSIESTDAAKLVKVSLTFLVKSSSKFTDWSIYVVS